MRGLEYSPGMHFEVFVAGAGRAAGAGGRYDELMARFGRPMPAVGLSLYLDTIALLKKFTANPSSDYRCVTDVRNFKALEQIFARDGSRIAGIIAEAPTNPLIQTGDLDAIAALARRHGARVIVDPAIVSPFNVDVLRFAGQLLCLAEAFDPGTLGAMADDGAGGVEDWFDHVDSEPRLWRPGDPI